MKFFFRLTRYLFTLFEFPFRSEAVYITFLSLKLGGREGGGSILKGGRVGGKGRGYLGEYYAGAGAEGRGRGERPDQRRGLGEKDC